MRPHLLTTYANTHNNTNRNNKRCERGIREKKTFFFSGFDFWARWAIHPCTQESNLVVCVEHKNQLYTYRVLGSCCQQPQQAVHITGIKVYLSLSWGRVCVYDFNPVDLLLDSFLSFFPFFSILFCWLIHCCFSHTWTTELEFWTPFVNMLNEWGCGGYMTQLAWVTNDFSQSRKIEILIIP
jgi:hypothetical protein